MGWPYSSFMNSPTYGPRVFAFMGICLNSSGYIASKVPQDLGTSGNIPSKTNSTKKYSVNKYFLVNLTNRDYPFDFPTDGMVTKAGFSTDRFAFVTSGYFFASL